MHCLIQETANKKAGFAPHLVLLVVVTDAEEANVLEQHYHKRTGPRFTTTYRQPKKAKATRSTV
jgi:hypothetical protein